MNWNNISGRYVTRTITLEGALTLAGILLFILIGFAVAWKLDKNHDTKDKE